MSDQADGLRQWMKRSRAASLARDSGSVRREPHEPIHGRTGEVAVLDSADEPVRDIVSTDPASDRADGDSLKEVVLM
jgi:hypothetical protein